MKLYLSLILCTAWGYSGTEVRWHCALHRDRKDNKLETPWDLSAMFYKQI